VQADGGLEQVRGLTEPARAVVVEPAQQRGEHVQLAVDDQHVVGQQAADALRRKEQEPGRLRHFHEPAARAPAAAVPITGQWRHGNACSRELQ